MSSDRGAGDQDRRREDRTESPVTSEELTTLARECDALVEKYGAEGETVEELSADLQRRLHDEQARLRAEIDQLEAREAWLRQREEEQR
jgi:hypothetical protein